MFCWAEWSVLPAPKWTKQLPESLSLWLSRWVCMQHYGVQWSYQRWYYVDTLREYGERCLLADKVDTEG